MHMTRALVIWSMVSLLALNGCGGGGGGDTNSSSTPVTGNAIKKGVAVDPYIVGAVFHEVAADGVTILQQQSTSSDTNGAFSFPNPLTPGSTVEMKVSSKGLHAGVPFQGLLRRTIKADDVLTVTVSPLTTLLANGIPPNEALLSLNHAGFSGLTTADLYANPMNGLADLTSGITDQKLKLLQAAMTVEGYMEITGNFHPTISDITNISQTQILDSLAAIMRANLSTSEFARVSAALAGDPQITSPLTLGDLIMAVTQQQQNLISQIKSDIAANGDFNPTLAGQIGQSIREQTVDMVKALYLVRNGNLSSPSIIVTANGSMTTNESGLPATFSVRLGSMPTADVIIPVQSSDTTEGTVDKSSLRFTNANWNTDQIVTVTGVSDALVDGNVAYIIILGATISTDSLYNNLNPDDLNATNLDARTAFFVVSSISGNTSESGIKANFTVRLGSIPVADVTIPVLSSDASEATVDKSSLTFTTSNWNQDQTVTVTGVSDLLADGPISYSIQLGTTTSNDGIYNALNPPDVTVTNTDVRSASFVIGAISGSTSESGTTATFTVRLGSQPTDNVTIPVSSADTSEGTVVPASLTFTNANWNTDQTVTVTGVSDLLGDGNVVYSIVLGTTTSPDVIYNVQNPPDVTVTNTDVRAAASFEISTISGSTSESGTTATFTVRLGSQPTGNVTIPVSSADTSEGTVAPASLTFTNANWNTDQTVTVTGVSDLLGDGNVGYSIVLGTTTSADSLYNNLNPNDVSVTNLDVRTASFVVSVISNNTTEGLATATFTVRLGSQPTADVTIPVSSSDTSEGTADTSSLTFTNSNWSTDQIVTVTGVDDPLADGDIYYTIQLGLTGSIDDIYSGLDPVDIGLTNIDMKTGNFEITPGTTLTTNESGLTAAFLVRLTSQPSSDVTIPVASSDTSEGTVDKASLTFTSGNWNQDQTVTVTGVYDSDDIDISYSIQLGITFSVDDNYNGLNPANVTVINQNVLASGFIISVPSDTDESGRQATFTVRLDFQPTSDVTIPVSSSNTNEGTVDKDFLVFTYGNYNEDQTVTVTGVDDSVADGNQSYSIILGPTSSAVAIYNGLDPADVTLSNIDLVDPYGVTPKISAGPYHSLVLASDGTVWGWGPCNGGQIDAAPTTCSGSFAIPQRLNITKASAVSAGYSFSTIVKADGTVWTSGANEYGQLGHASGPSLAQVDELTDVKAVSSGSYHTLAIKIDGSVWAWGNGGFGQLGNGLNDNSQTPVPALGDLAGKTVTAIAVGDLHSVALDNVGKAYSWGSDVSEQLGLGTGNQSTLTPTVISSLTDVSAIAAGQQYSFAVGTYTSPTMVVVTDTYGWGSNNDGQLGVTASAAPKSLPTRVGFFSDTVKPSLLDGGYQHSLALYGNTVYAWGDNDDVNETNEGWDNRGALGNGGISDVTTPAVSFAGASAKAVSTGNNHSLVLLSDGRVQSSGRNNTAQLGTNEVDIGPEIYTATPVYVEDPGDSGKGTIKYLYAYRPILSGQPASATTFTTAKITVCAEAVLAYCQGITHYKYSTSNGASWSLATPIGTTIDLPDLPAGTVNLWVKGMNSISNEIQTDNSAVKVSWTVN